MRTGEGMGALWSRQVGSRRVVCPSWMVSVRCAVLDGHVARVYAGNGIVADSDPATELAETRSKLQAMLSALVRP